MSALGWGALVVVMIPVALVVWDWRRAQRRLRMLARRDRMIADFEAAQTGAAAQNGRAASQVEGGGASNTLVGGNPAGPASCSGGDRAGVDSQAKMESEDTE